MKRPDFFIVGAFKAGTTSLYDYLGQHPQIFLPFHKEPMYFGADLDARYQKMSEEDYLGLFADARPDQRVGEASPWYLYSTSAAAEIKAFAPEAQIIVMLRNPVDVMHAQHSQLLFNQREDLANFGEALVAEDARRRGERIPAGALRREALFYRHSVRFAEQLQRYFDVFGRDRVHVIIHDDLRDDTAGVVRATFEFLGVDPMRPIDLGVRNPNRRARLDLVQRLVYRPPGPLRRLAPWLRRFPLVHRLRDAVVTANSRPEARAPMDPVLRQGLIRELAPQVEALGQLIGRDLSAWSRPETAAGNSSRGTPSNLATYRAVRIDTIVLDDLGFDRCVETILHWGRERSGGYVCTPNVDYVVRARRDARFRDTVMGARVRVPDGMGIVYGARLAGRRLSGSVTGRLLPEAIARHSDAPTLALLGGTAGAVPLAAERLRLAGGRVVAAESPTMGFRIGDAEDMAAVTMLQRADPAILFVGLGSPKQDHWMERHAADLPGTVMIGIGAGIDVLGGVQPAAPAWMTRIGLEWAYRLIHDPRRLARRYLREDPRFFWWMLRSRHGGSST
jgi:exopolysaccharide biosynthesis WecB/TagA/CpsF family protein